MKRLIHLILTTALCTIAIAPLAAQSKEKKKNPERIGDRDVGSGINFYSLEREIALGKQLARRSSARQNLWTLRFRQSISIG